MTIEKTDDDIERKDILVEGRVPLVGEQLALRNLAHAELCDKIDKAKQTEKARAKLARVEITRLAGDCARLKEEVLTASEPGMIHGFEQWNYRTGEVSTFRGDTGHQISVRPMSAEERSAWKEPPLKIDLGPGAAPAEGAQKRVLRRAKGGKPAAKKAH